MRYRIPLLLVVLAAIPAWGNTGIPMAFVTIPPMILAFIPIVLIEAWLVRAVTCVPFKEALKVMVVANLITTFVGMPLSNILSYLYSLVGKLVLLVCPQTLVQANSTLLRAVINFHWYDNFDHQKYLETHIRNPRPQLPIWYSVLALGLAFLVNWAVSSYLEYRYMRYKMTPPPRQLLKASLLANSASYLFLVLFSFWWLTQIR